MSNTLAYRQDYVIQSILRLRPNRTNEVHSYRYYTINSQWAEEKPPHIHNWENKPVQLTHYWAIVFYWTKTRGKSITNYYNNLSITLSQYFQQNSISLKAVPHWLATLYPTQPIDPERYDTKTILSHKRYLLI